MSPQSPVLTWGGGFLFQEQAAEREHEREEFQQEIQRLEGQLRQAARPRPPGPRDSQVGQPVVSRVCGLLVTATF